MDHFESSTRTGVLLPRASQAGSHRQQGSSVSALLSTLIPAFVVAVIAFVIFLALRSKLERVYSPRTYLATLHRDERSPKQSPGIFGWIKEYRDLTDSYVLGHSTLDNYLWLRFFKTLIVMCLVGTIITWPILFPVNATGGGGQSGLDILSFSNVQNPNRYYAHWIVACIFLGFAMLLITRETIFFINLRQAYLLSPLHASRISTKTVIFTNVPEKYRDEGYLRRTLSHVRHIWFTYDCEDLQDAVDERADNTDKLEKGETKLLSNYTKKHGDVPSDRRNINGTTENDNVSQPDFQIEQKDRMTHRLKPLIGRKVDTIDWTRAEIHRQNTEILEQQTQFMDGRAQRQGAVCVEFETVRAAQAAFLQVTHQTPLHLTPAAIGVMPSMVIWKNITKPWWKTKLFSALSTAFIVFLCLFWTIPVAFIGILTNVNYIVDKAPFLSFINDIPSQILGIVTGLLPTILLALLMKLVPIISFVLAKQFEPTLSAASMKVQSWYFAFQVIQVFLITTFTSGAASVATQIVNDPTQAATLLAKNLPKASNFYIAYFVLEGLGLAALQFMNVAPLLLWVLGKFLDKTPRKKFVRYVALPGVQWGALYPVMTNLGVIALAYSCIAPLVLGFATIGFSLIYLAFRYNMFFTQGLQFDVKGAAYARALQQLTVGIYLAEFCLIGLFAINTGGSVTSVGPLVLMIAFTVLTILYHIQIRKVLHKHTIALPNDLMMREEHFQLSNKTDEEAKQDVDMSNNSLPDHTEPQNGTPKTSKANAESMSYVPQPADPPPPPSGFMGRMKRAMFPTKHETAATLAKYTLSPYLTEPVKPYTERERREAYMHPAITDEAPRIWIPRDAHGLSRREVMACRKVIGEQCDATDEGAWLDEKGKVQWDETRVEQAPLWEEPCLY